MNQTQTLQLKMYLKILIYNISIGKKNIYKTYKNIHKEVGSVQIFNNMWWNMTFLSH